MTEVVRVRSPYLGRSFYVAKADLDNPKRVMLPMYTRTGTRWSETKAGRRSIMTGEGGGYLARANIGAMPLTEAETAAILSGDLT